VQIHIIQEDQDRHAGRIAEAVVVLDQQLVPLHVPYPPVLHHVKNTIRKEKGQQSVGEDDRSVELPQEKRRHHIGETKPAALVTTVVETDRIVTVVLLAHLALGEIVENIRVPRPEADHDPHLLVLLPRSPSLIAVTEGNPHLRIQETILKKRVLISFLVAGVEIVAD
jgi:hypothetical protein